MNKARQLTGTDLPTTAYQTRRLPWRRWILTGVVIAAGLFVVAAVGLYPIVLQAMEHIEPDTSLRRGWPVPRS